MTPEQRLEAEFAALNERIVGLEAAARASADGIAPAGLVDEAIDTLNGLMTAYATHAGKPIPVTDDPLEVFKAYVKGDPSLNAIRDNVRELVYYRNCLAQGRQDALPGNSALMTAHTARHVYLYLRTRCAQEHRLP
ncbi:hypothetical protein BW247_06425 [Acidihalobacter ferrooxydans]|uniref:Uncharacterized protein n=1 Tax=Acidihalobacter ferrooxydans TaxID=1765967 RepID=A0A1P8UL56_9GAMM|nr:hypothetical protein BW247_06425 [Acidihalobacter ferrooxydans]